MTVLSWVAGLFAALSVAAFFGDQWWAFDVIAGLRPQMAVAMALVAAWLGLGRSRVMPVAALGALLNAAVVLPLFLVPSAPDPMPAMALRVLSFNLFDQNEAYGKVIEFIRGSEADVVFLHEAFRPWEEAITDAGLPYRIEVLREGDLIFGTMVLTRIPATVTGFGFAESDPRAAEVALELPGGPVALLGVHPLSPTSAERAALRDSQLEFAGDWARRQASRSIVVGDFNATPWSASFRHLLDQGRLHNSQRGYGLELSFPVGRAIWFQVPIDHLLHSDGLVVLDRRLGPDLGSDHLPLVVDLAFTEKVES